MIKKNLKGKVKKKSEENEKQEEENEKQEGEDEFVEEYEQDNDEEQGEEIITEGNNPKITFDEEIGMSPDS